MGREVTSRNMVRIGRMRAICLVAVPSAIQNTQRLGDYVLAHGYVREDHVLDADCRYGFRFPHWPKFR